MVLAALTSYPELWAAGVDIVGIANFAAALSILSQSEYTEGASAGSMNIGCVGVQCIMQHQAIVSVFRYLPIALVRARYNLQSGAHTQRVPSESAICN